MSEIVKVLEGHLRFNVKHSNQTLTLTFLRLREISHNVMSTLHNVMVAVGGAVKSFTIGKLGLKLVCKKPGISVSSASKICHWWENKKNFFRYNFHINLCRLNN